MTNSIQELTEKIYNEGVVKAKTEAEKILSEARKEAEKMTEAAQKEREHLLEVAEAEAKDIKKKAHSELTLAGQKLISNMEQQVAQLLTNLQVESLSDKAFQNEEFIEKMLLLVVEKWAKKNGEDSDLTILISGKDEEMISRFFRKKMIDKLSKGIEIKVDPSIRSGFKIGPADGHFIISFTGRDFENYFKTYLKERTWNLIFGNT